MDLLRVRHQARLVSGMVAGALAVGLSVAGMGLVALGLVLFLDVAGLVQVGAAPSVGVGLGTGLVLVTVGWFFLGAAWEGLLKHVPGPEALGRDRRAVGWSVSVLAVGAVLAGAGFAAGRHGPEVWPGLGTGAAFIQATGLTGMVVGPAVAGLLWAAERSRPGLIPYERWRVPILLVVWTGAALWLFDRWGF